MIPVGLFNHYTSLLPSFHTNTVTKILMFQVYNFQIQVPIRRWHTSLLPTVPTIHHFAYQTAAVRWKNEAIAIKNKLNHHSMLAFLQGSIIAH